MTRSSELEERHSTTLPTVLRVCREVLDVPDLDPHTNFFMAGGTSLVALRLLARLRAEGFRDISVVEFFDNATPHALAAVLAETAGPEPAAEPAPGDDRRPDVPSDLVELSIQQRTRLRAYEQAADGRTQPVVLRYVLHGDLELPALRRALDDIVRRHCVLATHYPDGPVSPGVVAEEERRHWPLEMLDLSHLTVGPGLFAELRKAIGGRPFNLREQPPVRGWIASTAEPATHVLVLAVDHVAFDEASEAVLLEELAVLYCAERQGTTPEPPSSLQYADYARRHNAALSSAEGRERVERTIEELYRDGFRPPLPLPHSADHDPMATGESRYLRFELAAGERADALGAALGRHSLTPYGFYLTAVAKGLAGLVTEDRFGVQISHAGRVLPGSETAIGCFTEPAFVFFDRHACAGTTGLLHQVRERLLAVLSDPSPLTAALEALQLAGRGEEVRRLRRRPHVLFNMENRGTGETVLDPGLRLSRLSYARTDGRLVVPVINLYVLISPGRHELLVEFVRRAWPKRLIEDMGRRIADAATDLAQTLPQERA